MTDMSFWSEGGPVEVASALLLLLAAAVLAVQAVRRPALWHLPVLALLLAAREQDLDKATPWGILKLRTYTGDAPLWMKLFGGAVIVLVLWSLWRLVRHGWRPFRRAWAERRAWPGLLVAGVVMVVAAKSIDGLNRKLEPFGLAVDDATSDLVVRMEESMELGFALCLLLAALTALRPARDRA